MLHAWFTQLNPDYADAETAQRIDALGQAAYAVVAVADGIIVGVAGLGGLWLDDDLTAGLENPAEVFSVYVAHAWLGRGVGLAMMDERMNAFLGQVGGTYARPADGSDLA